MWSISGKKGEGRRRGESFFRWLPFRYDSNIVRIGVSGLVDKRHGEKREREKLLAPTNYIQKGPTKTLAYRQKRHYIIQRGGRVNGE